ncbi:MAG: AAA family ATPase [Myxococcota bacterium]
MSEPELLLHGARLTASQVVETIDHIVRTNLTAEARGDRRTPLCIWGLHGVGKTALVQDYCQERGWHFAYCAPAQFEEMGDLHGLPKLEGEEGAEATVFAPPSWVPTEEGPGILLLDDVNRADDRILRGLMQLLQNYEMFSWKLPSKWQIVCTANPEGGDYSVTPMDDAMLTRMLHVSMVFDVKVWAEWASRANVDPRGISFALTYPESIVGRRTTPRSLTQFLEQIRPIEDLKGNAGLVQTLAHSSLDETTVASFMSFVVDGLEQLIDPETILEAEDWESVAARLSELAVGDEGSKRVDRLSTICTRLFLHVTHPDYALSPLHGENVVRFLLHDALPNDLRLSLHRDLVTKGSDGIKAAMRKSKKLADLILAGM